MTSWTTITDAETKAGQIFTQSLARKYRDNLRALMEDDASVPLADTFQRAGGQRRVIFGLSSFADDNVSRLQAYGAGATPFRSHNNGAGGDPASSGSTQTQAAHAGRFSVGTVALDFGVRTSGKTWLQAGLMSALGTRFALELNPGGGDVTVGTDPGGSSLVRIGGSVSIRTTMTWPAANGAGVLTNDGSGGLSWATASAIAAYFAKINSASDNAITSSATALVNRMNVVSGTSGNYDIPMPSASAGDVVAFRVKDYSAANKAYRLDAGGTVKIAGRTRYLTLVHTNSAIFIFNGTDWEALSLSLGTIWVDGGAVTPGATTSAPTKGTTSVDKMWWRRVGDSAEFRYEYVQSTGGANGTGTYLIPFIFTADTNKLNVTASGTVDQPRSHVGAGRVKQGILTLHAYDSTRIYGQFTTDATNALWGSGAGTWSGAFYCGLLFVIPIVDW